MVFVTTLSKIQFVFTIGFHILFPAFTIGLATILVIFEGIWICFSKINYYYLARFLNKLFALTFGMGIVSGIVMEFQLGTNWGKFSEKVGPVLGALFTYEVLTAFFIEAGALGIMLFGWDKVNKFLHYCATLCVFFGVNISAFWILSANSWMQTPAGVSYISEEFIVHNWLKVIINPSVLSRYFHMLISSYLSTCMVLLSVASYYIINHIIDKNTKILMYFSCLSIFFLSMLQIFVGDLVGIAINKYQPIKTATIEGVWDTQKRAPLLLFGYLNNNFKLNNKTIEIPKLASFINTKSPNGSLSGLKEIKKKNRPLLNIVFYSFRFMISLNIYMFFLSLISIILLIFNKFYKKRLFLKIIIFSAPLGFLTIIFGWLTAEFGRQPWVVYNLLKTKHILNIITKWKIVLSLIFIFIVYLLIFGKFYIYYLFKTIKQGINNINTNSNK